MCHIPSLMDINTGKVGENFITTQLTSSSLILKSTSYLEDEFQRHVGRTKRTDRTAELYSDPILSGYTDSDWAGSVDDRKSTVGYVFSLGSGAVTWTSKKQQVVAVSSTEAEYRGAVKASCEAVRLRRMLADMHASQTGPTSLFCDNYGVLKLAKNPVFHERTKHVETHCHYIRQLVEDGSVQLRYIPTSEQLADIFTKLLGPAKFEQFRGSIGVVNRLSIKGGY
eukprot:PITA_05234